LPERIFEYQDHWLVKRKDTPNYHIYWCRPGTRRVRRKSANTADLGRAKEELIRHARKRERSRMVEPDEIILLDALNDYVEPIIERSTRWSPERNALLHWSRFMAEYDIHALADLTLDMQDEYIRWRFDALREAGHGGSNSTIAREMGVMRACVRNQWKKGRLAHPPYIRSVPQSPPRPHFLYPEEVKRLLAECRERHLWLFVMISLHTLQRCGAVLGLRREQINHRAGYIDFLPEQQAQSRKRRPTVPISATLAPILQEAESESLSGYLIEHRRKPISGVRTSFGKACKRAGITNASPGTLRHTGATLLLAAGVDIREVSGMLGHTHQRTTELYGKHHPDFLSSARDTLDELFQPVIPACQ